MSVKSKAKLGVTLTLDSRTVTLFEGDIVHDLVVKSGSTEKVISGAVRVIDASTKANNMIPSDCPPMPYAARYITPYAIVIDSSDEYDAELTRVNVSNIVGLGEVEANGGAIEIGVGPQYQSLATVVSNASDGATVQMAEGVYTDPLVINKSINLVGNGNTVLTGALTLGVVGARAVGAEPIDITLDGLVLTENALVILNTVDSFTMTNCTIKDCNLSAKGYPIRMLAATPTKVVIEGNTFGHQNSFAYNLIESSAVFKDGSSISNNTFTADCCTHNQIGLYAVEDGATITISNNVFEYTYSGIRFGMKGTPDCTIIVENNIVKATKAGDPWAGMVTVQPYNKETATFEKTTIKLINNDLCEGNIIYVYLDSGCTQLTEAQYPVCYLDGEIYQIPLIV